jgi:hypothetical protein
MKEAKAIPRCLGFKRHTSFLRKNPVKTACAPESDKILPASNRFRDAPGGLAESRKMEITDEILEALLNLALRWLVTRSLRWATVKAKQWLTRKRNG